MRHPMISVIVPAYNCAKYLPQCLDSILAQTKQSIEIIIVDDQSTDDTQNIISQYSTANPGVIRPIAVEYGGQSRARNTGLDIASGQFVAFCDADDCYLPQSLNYLYSALKADDTCDIAIGGFVQGQTMPKGCIPYKPFLKYSPNTAIKKTLYQQKKFHNSVWAKLYRKSLFDNIRFVDGLYYEDLEITPRLYGASRSIAVTSSPVYFYRSNPSSFINTWHEGRLDAVKATTLILNFISEKYPELISAARSRHFSACYNIMLLALRHGRYDVARRCYDDIVAMRTAILTDSHVRLRNHLGALLSFVGFKTIKDLFPMLPDNDLSQ